MGEPKREVVTRFAPSPTGRMHLGHAYAALFAWDRAREAGGRFLVRIEDIDESRSKREYEEGIFEDLAWLGISWEEPVWRQSERREAYSEALLKLAGVSYFCSCTRKEIGEEIARAGGAPHGPEGVVYPGTCRGIKMTGQMMKYRSRKHATRIDMEKAFGLATEKAGGELRWREGSTGEVRVADPRAMGDVVLARKEMGSSYHLAVTVDDAAQGVTLVTRGEDLIHATDLHRVLQELLDLPVPDWHHHGLVRDGAGKRLATRDAAKTLEKLREDGVTAEEVRDSYRRLGAEMGTEYW